VRISSLSTVAFDDYDSPRDSLGQPGCGSNRMPVLDQSDGIALSRNIQGAIPVFLDYKSGRIGTKEYLIRVYSRFYPLHLYPFIVGAIVHSHSRAFVVPCDLCLMDDPSLRSSSTESSEVDANRRPIKMRSAPWAQGLARELARLGVSPNQVSLFSVVCALVGAGLFLAEAFSQGTPWFLIAAAICIQLRLLANMLDGLIAVEGGHQTKVGELYNEIPDRIADVLFLASAGYASQHGNWGVALGWSAAVLAVGTAYIRALGARRGAAQDFCGPVAKQQRMFLLTVGCFLAAGEHIAGSSRQTLFWILVIINLGTLVTCVRRTLHLAERLETAS
jgi:phosphatidylglycerophosphate synthase